MNRRQLLAAFLGSAAAVTAGELLITTRKIFLPPRGGWDLDVYAADYSLHLPMGGTVWTFDEPPPAGSRVQLTFDGGTVSAYVDGKLVRFGTAKRLIVDADSPGVMIQG
jgi:hypothetical protein